MEEGMYWALVFGMILLTAIILGGLGIAENIYQSEFEECNDQCSKLMFDNTLELQCKLRCQEKILNECDLK
ncbi:MAG: hypothetical protein Q7R52_00185 [archaeon]|nr:hypothetical protein [archaeon]